MSAFWGSATCLVLYFILLKLTRYKWLAFLSSLFFSTTHSFWLYSLAARHSTLNLFFYTTVIFLLLKWHSERKDYQLYLALLIYGLSLGNHLTIIFLFPAVAYIIFVTDRKIFLTKKMLFLVLSLFVLECLLYSFLFIRTFQKAPYLNIPIRSWSKFFWFVSGAQFQEIIFNFFLQKTMLRIKENLFPCFWEQFSYPALALLGVFGLFFVCIQRKKKYLFLILCAFPSLLYVLILNYEKIFIDSRHLLHFYFMFMLFIGLGVSHVLDLIKNQKIRKIIYFVMILYLAIGIQFSLNKNYFLVDQSKNIQMQTLIEKTLNEIGEHALILEESYDYHNAFMYYLLVDDRWKDKNIYVILVPHHVRLSQVRKYLKGKYLIRLALQDYRRVPWNLSVYTLYPFPGLRLKKISSINEEISLYKVHLE